MEDTKTMISAYIPASVALKVAKDSLKKKISKSAVVEMALNEYYKPKAGNVCKKN